ncbi:MAG: hypothetical protein ACO1NM_13675 [Sphingobium phenoxybenzoativorans]
MQINRRELNGLLFASPFFLPSCSVLSDIVFRYRLTVNVRTPQGLSTGSSVIEIRSSSGSNWLGPEASTARAEIIGEAVTVKLPSGELLFALLHDPSGDAVSCVFAAYGNDLSKLGKAANWEVRTKALQHMSGIREVPPDRYPMIVRFENILRPSSIENINPMELSSVFGAGYAIDSVTAEITDEHITSGISDTLPWIDEYYGKMLDGSRLGNGSDLASNVSTAFFMQGQ